jgi:predicted AlkP superfamily pyrophosphatase or phosphodiesterase
MCPDFYRRAHDYGLKIPNILSLAESGASADAVESIYPTTTYPAHATIVTGVPPSVHGIYSHLASLDPTEQARPWCWFARAMKVPTIWDVMHARGRKTAAISWPVSAGAAIDYNIPEIWDPEKPDPLKDLETAAKHSTPGLFAEVLKALQPILPSATPDRLRGEAALRLWNHHHPDLLLVHFVDYDQKAHQFGPTSRGALAAIEKVDVEIGRIRETVGDHTVIVVLSDHGFVPVEKEAAPLVILAEEGLLGKDDSGQFTLKRMGAVHAGGSFAVYWLATGAVAEVMGSDELRELEADPDAELMLDAATGFYFSGRLQGPAVCTTTKDRGTHGQLPTREGLEAAFIAAGPRIKAGKNLGRASLRQIAPTLVRMLDLPTDILAPKENSIDLS